MSILGAMLKRSGHMRARDVFAANLHRHRKSLGFSQEHLADLAGVHRTYIGSVERGECNISIDNIEKIAKAMALPVAVLLSAPRTKGLS